MKGILLAGGSGTRLHPATAVISKQLLPVYDKPMVYYPLSTLMLAGIREVMLISTPHDLPLFEQLLGDGSAWGMELTYAEQPRPEGIAQALLIARDWLDGEGCCLILGDNLFYGHGLTPALRAAADQSDGATVFGYQVTDPQRYGVLELSPSGAPVSIEEKPQSPKSSWAVVGLYFYDRMAPDIAAAIRPSQRGELEISDVNRTYLERGALRAEKLGRGIAWLDTGTHESLLEAANFIRAVQHRQGMAVACLEEIAYKMGWIGLDRLRSKASEWRNSDYGNQLRRVVDEAATP
ncbi:MAG: glucose-1-phosphate thymidylyltransferase RfbA [Armatimonadetes bacterium]|nr:glucose-1-phosphate thymidylyltransferase RfbA [Armatimonadota bacterium]MDE2207568.1 glucose-1-phosphate thymidylyltransferase RfbA [Armatimonadota bacterium]